MNDNRNRKQVATSVVLIGVGFGGFADGILLHQILQWHHMLSTILPPEGMQAMRINMMWDGYFHTVVWVIALAGVFMLWNYVRRLPVLPGNAWFAGLLVIGWGIFNLVEGILDHHILNIHHVRRYAPDPAWDFGFLIVGGLGFMIAGWLIKRMDTSDPRPDVPEV